MVPNCPEKTFRFHITLEKKHWGYEKWSKTGQNAEKNSRYWGTLTIN